MMSTTYIHKNIVYFFSRSQQIDMQIGIGLQKQRSLASCIDIMQQSVSTQDSNSNLMKNRLLQAILNIQSRLVKTEPISAEQKQFQQKQFDAPAVGLQYQVNVQQYLKFYHNDGLKCSIFGLSSYLQFLGHSFVTNTGSMSNIVTQKTNNSTNKVNIVDEMIIKGYINIIYILIYCFKDIYIHQQTTINLKAPKEEYQLKPSTNPPTSRSQKPPPLLQSLSQQQQQQQLQLQAYKLLKSKLQELDIDALLIKVVTLTLEAYYIPIKKLVMLYTRILDIMFSSSKQFTNLPAQPLYSDDQLLSICSNNQLPQNFLQNFKQKNKPQDIRLKSKNNPVQSFYAKHNVGDCPLAQSIVVGLLRSLLTICNSQIHKKFVVSPAKGTGADSYREWQVSYQFINQLSISKQVKQAKQPKQSKQSKLKDYKQYLSKRSLTNLQNYIQYNDLSSDALNPAPAPAPGTNSSAPATSLPTHYQFYRHKIYTTSAISTFFSFLLINFKENAMIQFTYLYQLISDANGVLVFLKFLTDKFQFLEPQDQIQPSESSQAKEKNQIYKLKFKDQVMLTVYSVLLILYGACNNYAQKTKSYLFQYNSYLIIKKIPHIFMKVHKNDDQLPSQQQIQAQFGNFKNNSSSNDGLSKNTGQANLTEKVKQLTQLCYSLLKIQIPFFSKKMKQNTNNMKMIVDIYCQMPKKTEPIKRTQLDKLLLKNKMKKTQNEKYINSVEELKGLHNQYNNLYYWSNEQGKIAEANQKDSASMGQISPTKVPVINKSVSLNQNIKKTSSKQENYLKNSEKQRELQIQMTRQQMNKWLQQNVWKFYD